MDSEQTSSSTPPQSPRLAALWSDIKNGDNAALDRFWQEVEKQGTPLIEPIKGDVSHSLVTFLYRADEPVENVAVISPLGGFNPRHLEPFLMLPLGDTGLWHKSYTAR